MFKKNNKKIRNPIVFSLVSFFLMSVTYRIIQSILINSAGVEFPKWYFIDGALRGAMTIPAIICLGVVLQQNGFKFAFSLEGSRQALLASCALLLWTLTPMLHFLNIYGLNESYLNTILPMLFFQTSSSIYEEIFLRGLLMTAILIKFSGTVKGRLLCVLFSAVIFGLGHSNQGLVGIFLVTLGGIAYGAAYLYSGNLTILMFVHALWNISIRISDGFFSGNVHSEVLTRVVQFIQPIILIFIIPAFAIFITIKAKPFPETLSKLLKTEGVET